MRIPRVDGQIVIEHIEFLCNIGVTADERRVRQPVGVDLELDYPPEWLAAATSSDRIENAVDYSKIVQRVVDVGSGGEHQLIERLADQLIQVIFSEFPVTAASIWVRKLAPPLSAVRQSVGIKLSNSKRSSANPSDLLIQYAPLLQKGLALDVAAGRGRNALYLAECGYTVDAIDRDRAALDELMKSATERGLTTVTPVAIDLEGGHGPIAFPRSPYDLIAVFFYLYRPLFPALIAALAPGGLLFYETFLIDNHERHGHPRRREFCLAHNELLRLAQGLRVVSYEEGERRNGGNAASIWTARLVAKKEC